MESQCDNSSDQLYGGLFGFGKLNGNHWGGQAEFLRVPFADFTSFVVPDTAIPDEKVLFYQTFCQLPTGVSKMRVSNKAIPSLFLAQDL